MKAERRRIPFPAPVLATLKVYLAVPSAVAKAMADTVGVGGGRTTKETGGTPVLLREGTKPLPYVNYPAYKAGLLNPNC